MKRLKEQIEKEKDPEVKAEVKKGNIVTYDNRRFYGLLGKIYMLTGSKIVLKIL